MSGVNGLKKKKLETKCLKLVLDTHSPIRRVTKKGRRRRREEGRRYNYSERERERERAQLPCPLLHSHSTPADRISVSLHSTARPQAPGGPATHHTNFAGTAAQRCSSPEPADLLPSRSVRLLSARDCTFSSEVTRPFCQTFFKLSYTHARAHALART